MAATDTFGELGLSIIGVGAHYPPYGLKPVEVEKLGAKHYPESPAMMKVLSINRYTGIDTRSSIGTSDHPLVNQKDAPTIAQLHKTFMCDGVPLAVEASKKAIAEARIDVSQITHVVATTCTDSANPGFDHYVVKQLGISHQVEKVLLHGVGCSGGLAILRTAANLALGHTARRKPARILCVALEVSTTMVRSEMDSINETQETRIGVCLFSDCGSAVVLSNGVGPQTAPPVYDLLGWDHSIIPNTEDNLGFDVHPNGWKVILTPQVPKLAAESMAPSFAKLVGSIPELPQEYRDAADFDWALHPGGATILTGAERALGISSQHLRASYTVYMGHGNSSSATIFSVMHTLRGKDMDNIAPEGRAKDFVVGCAFGPGISVEMCILKRNMGARRISGLITPPETDSEGSRSGGEEEVDWANADPLASIPESLASAEPHGTVSTGLPTDDNFINEALASVELD
ncbi:chalcone and stilbene synthase domain-containing protein [Pseudomassariella vexata]|uniref:Chalcone and stilbene synthase domain-containing protein n=1 Tax=Pseudomassariella vexata TaxID=1141098 RepID=A0A1Y2DQG3_9PEZI|nr:chalcone and stilbene synthase domain-containing protein [Pseudomassariella vexata]ORY61447.1 chalcone and stilbene synthase domain-containing protein [Pseudomassariella vexata]